jgi:stage IV sporulation protein FB
MVVSIFVIRFSIFGIPVEIQPFFWVSLVILGGATQADSAAAIFQIALFVLAGFISILVHELGHALTARAFGAQCSITLQSFGGYAAYAGVSLNRLQRFLVTAAGPGIQIVLGIAVLLSIPYIPFLNHHSWYLLRTLMFISFFWSILNLLPVLPLDGGQMLNAILGPQRIKITLWTTIVVAIAASLSMYTYTRSIIFPIFLGMYAWQAFQDLKERRYS